MNLEELMQATGLFIEPRFNMPQLKTRWAVGAAGWDAEERASVTSWLDDDGIWRDDPADAHEWDSLESAKAALVDTARSYGGLEKPKETNDAK